MSNLKSLTFTVLPNKSADPAVRRREKLIEKLNEQLKLVRNPNFKITFNRWETNDAGFLVNEIIRRHGIAEQTFYRWKSKFGGMEVSDAKRLRELLLENYKLKKLLAEQMLDNTTLKDFISRKL